MAGAGRDDSDKGAVKKRGTRGTERDGTQRKRENATKRRVELGVGVGRASDGRRDGRLDSITWRTILLRRHCLYEHLLRLSWSGTPSVVSHVPLHHDILFACYNTVDDDDKDRDEDEDESEDEDDEDKDKDKDVDGENCCCLSRRPWHPRKSPQAFVLYR